jgi:hypothetical protein
MRSSPPSRRSSPTNTASTTLDGPARWARFGSRGQRQRHRGYALRPRRPLPSRSGGATSSSPAPLCSVRQPDRRWLADCCATDTSSSRSSLNWPRSSPCSAPPPTSSWSVAPGCSGILNGRRPATSIRPAPSRSTSASRHPRRVPPRLTAGLAQRCRRCVLAVGGQLRRLRDRLPAPSARCSYARPGCRLRDEAVPRRSSGSRGSRQPVATLPLCRPRRRRRILQECVPTRTPGRVPEHVHLRDRPRRSAHLATPSRGEGVAFWAPARS